MTCSNVMTRPAGRAVVPAALLSAALLLTGRAAHAQTAAPPATATPSAAASEDLPAICTDRPTKSNFACVVEPGHWQVESDLFNGAFLHADGSRTDTYLITNPTLKYGLAKDVDVEVNIAPYEVVRSRAAGEPSSTLTGVGDLFLRAKWNFLNVGDAKLQITALPYVKAPTARLGIGDGAWEGGFLLPVNYKLSDKLTLTTVPEVDALKDSVGDGRHANTAQLVNLGYSLPHDLTLYGELWTDWNFDPARTVNQTSADVALAWGVSKHLQLDAGLNFGLNRATPGVQAYVGVSKKW